MKKQNNKKKGFTIVELVIVIAVIAILAAVLIPTFSGVVEKANKSAALQACRNELVEVKAAYAMNGGDVTDGVVFNSGNYYYEYKDGELTETTEPTGTATALENVNVYNSNSVYVLTGDQNITGLNEFYTNGNGDRLLVYFGFTSTTSDTTLVVYNDDGDVVYNHKYTNSSASGRSSIYFSAYYDSTKDNTAFATSYSEGNIMNIQSKDAAIGYYTYTLTVGDASYSGVFYYTGK